MRRVMLEARSYRNEVMRLGPVAYWRLGEPAGTVAGDETGTNVGAYVNNPTRGVTGALAGDVNGAVTLTSASGHRVTAAASASLDAIADEMTYLAWVKRAAVSAIQILTTKNAANSFTIRWLATNELQLVKIGGAALATGNTAVADAGWHMAAVTKSASGCRIYLDGADDTGATSSDTLSAVSAVLYVAGFSASGFDGTADDVAIWNRALTAAEIAHLYQVGRGY